VSVSAGHDDCTYLTFREPQRSGHIVRQRNIVQHNAPQNKIELSMIEEKHDAVQTKHDHNIKIV
jgi:hypothetical protein